MSESLTPKAKFDNEFDEAARLAAKADHLAAEADPDSGWDEGEGMGDGRMLGDETVGESRVDLTDGEDAHVYREESWESKEAFGDPRTIIGANKTTRTPWGTIKYETEHRHHPGRPPQAETTIIYNDLEGNEMGSDYSEDPDTAHKVGALAARRVIRVATEELKQKI